jgi:hypothetical protein
MTMKLAMKRAVKATISVGRPWVNPLAPLGAPVLVEVAEVEAEDSEPEGDEEDEALSEEEEEADDDEAELEAELDSEGEEDEPLAEALLLILLLMAEPAALVRLLKVPPSPSPLLQVRRKTNQLK